MKIKYHGGSNCGMFHIHGLAYGGPEATLDPILVPKDSISQDNIFRGKAPAESGEARLKRYLKYIKTNHRTNCIIEITLVGAGFTYDQQTAWDPVLRDLGFKCVNHCLNSGSSRRIAIYHLNWDDKTSLTAFEKRMAKLDEKYTKSKEPLPAEMPTAV